MDVLGSRVDLLFSVLNIRRVDRNDVDPLPTSLRTPSSLLSSVCSFPQTPGCRRCLKFFWMKTVRLIRGKRWVVSHACQQRALSARGSQQVLLVLGRGWCPWEWGKIGSELIPLESRTNHKKDQAWGEVTEASQIAGLMTSLFKIRYFVQCETFDLWFWLKSISLSLTCLDIRFFLLPPYISHLLGISNLPHYRFGPKKHWHIRIMLCLI